MTQDELLNDQTNLKNSDDGYASRSLPVIDPHFHYILVPTKGLYILCVFEGDATLNFLNSGAKASNSSWLRGQFDMTFITCTIP